MLPEVSLNYWAILSSVAISMVVGYVWYARPVFGRTWMNLIGKMEEELKKASGASMGLALPIAFVASYVMAHMIEYTQSKTAIEIYVAKRFCSHYHSSHLTHGMESDC